MACRLQTFLGCASLRTGTLVAGFAGIILSVIYIIVMFTARLQLKTIVLDDLLDQNGVRILMTISFVMTILICIILIVGTIRRNMYLMIPWVVLGLMLVIGLLVSVIYTSVDYFIHEDTLNGSLVLVLGLIFFVIYLYMWFVVYSFFCIIKEEHDRGAYIKDPFRRHY